jgi:hypothetical protein
MHRSGTSLVARLLQECGLDLGPPSELVPADEHNADGYHEHRGFVAVNDAILQLLGGGWDAPPAPAPGWEQREEFAPLDESARELVEGFAASPRWGWKDPRSSLTLPFWQRVLPDLRVVICVRNPVEVLLSLQRRGLTSPALGLHLWDEYNRRALAAVPPDRRLITCYASYLDDAAAELTRVAGALELSAEGVAVAAAVASVNPELRHHHGDDELRRAGVPAETVELYRLLLVEASGGPPVPEEETRAAAVPAAPTDEGLGRLAAVLSARQEAAAYRADRDAWRRKAERRGGEAARTVQELERVRRRLAGARTTIVAAGEREAGLAAELERLRSVLDRHAADAAAQAAATATARAELAAAEQRHGAAAADARRLADELTALRGRLEELARERDEWRRAEDAATSRYASAIREFETLREELAAARASSAEEHARALEAHERLT